MQRQKGIKYIFISLLLISGLSRASYAQDFDVLDRLGSAFEVIQDGVDSLWPGGVDFDGFRVSAGIGIGFTPDYIGSNNYRPRALPIFDIYYKKLWRITGSRFTYNYYTNGNLTVGPVVALRFGRKEGRNKALQGLGDIDNTLEVGGFLNYKRESLIFYADIRQALDSNKGQVARLTLSHGIFKKNQFMGAVALHAKWLSKDASQTLFGISPAQAANSEYNLDQFTAGAGLSQVSANFIVAHRYNKKTRSIALLSIGQLMGDARQSPISGAGPNDGQGSRTQIIIGTAVTFQF